MLGLPGPFTEARFCAGREAKCPSLRGSGLIYGQYRGCAAGPIEASIDRALAPVCLRISKGWGKPRKALCHGKSKSSGLATSREENSGHAATQYWRVHHHRRPSRRPPPQQRLALLCARRHGSSTRSLRPLAQAAEWPWLGRCNNAIIICMWACSP